MTALLVRLAAAVASCVAVFAIAVPVDASPDRDGGADDSIEIEQDVDGDGVDADVSAPSFDAPIVALNRYSVNVDEVVTVTVAGFQSRVVTISICGNKGLRGSTDCNVQGSEGLGLDGDGTAKLARMPAAAPPVPCPCIVRVASTGTAEVATADITLVGHPTGELVQPEGFTLEPLDVTLDVERASSGFMGSLSSGLGGATTYDVTVRVTNPSEVAVERVSVSGSVGRSEGDVMRSLQLGAPGSIGPGETWEGTTTAELPAPVYGGARWSVDVANAGLTVTAKESTSHTPILLFLAVLVLAADLIWLTIRAIRRRGGEPDNDTHPDEPDEPDDADQPDNSETLEATDALSDDRLSAASV